MKTFKKIWGMLVLVGATAFSVFAQEGQVDPSSASITLETAMAGRQAIASSLIRQAHHIVVRPTGSSVVEKRDVCFTSQDLFNAGYVTAGSISELVHAIFVCSSRVDFDIVEVNGSFDIGLDVLVMSADGQLVLRGFGYPEAVQATDEVRDEFRVKFNMNLGIPENLTVATTGQVNAAKWVSKEGDEIQLSSWNDESGNGSFEIQNWLLNQGTLVLSLGGEKGGKDIIAYNLSDKTSLIGHQAYAYISGFYHWDFRPYVNDFAFFKGESLIYEFGGELYGEIPLINLTLSRPVQNVVINPLLEIWGSKGAFIRPDRIFVQKLSTFNEDGQIGTEFPKVELEFNPPAGGWIFSGEAGDRYHFFIEVDGLRTDGKG